MSKTTKLLLLDSLLQEVCIESGSDGSLSLSSLGMSVCLVSHNLLYSGLKKAHSKKEIIQQEMCCGYSDIPGGKKLLPAGWKLAHDHSCLRKRPSSAFTSPGMSTWSPPAWSIGSDSVSALSVSQSVGHKRGQNYAKCLQQPVFPGGHPSKY